MALTRVQSNTLFGSSAAPSVDIGAVPAAGDLVVVSIAVGAIGRTVTLAGFTEIPTDSPVTLTNVSHSVFYKIADGAAGSDLITGSISGGTTTWRIVATQYHDSAGGTWRLDKSAHNSASTTGPADSGTTATTSAASEVWVGVLSASLTRTQTSPTNSFTLVQGATTTLSSYLYEKIVSATGTANVAASLSGTCNWVGTIATFTTAATGVTYNDAPSGGLVLGGAPVQVKVYDDVPSGGIALSGSVVQSKAYDDVRSDGIALGGTVALSKVFDSSPTGGIVLGGTCTSASFKGYADTPAGGLVLGGTATSTRTVGYVEALGLVLGGTAASSRTVAYTQSGGIVLGGTCTSAVFKGYSDTPAGGIVLGGSVAQAKSYASTVSAGLVLGGSTVSTRTLALTCSGGLVLGGSVVSDWTHAGGYSDTPSGGIVLGGSVTLAILAWSYPVADLLDGNWTDQAGGHNLWAAIDEVDPDDADYIVSSANPSPADVCQVALSVIGDPVSSTGHKVVYRYGSDTDAFVTATQTLTGAQADAIANYTNLSLKFEAVS